MANFTVHHGRTYRAKLHLSFLETFASDDMVAQRFEELGFVDVVVTGEGPERIAQGIWNGPDESVPLTDQHVESVDEVKVPHSLAPKLEARVDDSYLRPAIDPFPGTPTYPNDEDGPIAIGIGEDGKKLGGGIGGMPLPPNEEVDGG